MAIPSLPARKTSLPYAARLEKLNCIAFCIIISENLQVCVLKGAQKPSIRNEIPPFALLTFSPKYEKIESSDDLKTENQAKEAQPWPKKNAATP